MGALHEGHISLVEKSKKENEKTLVSIFVNPTQFNDPKDLERYPRTLTADLKKLADVGVDDVLFPEASEIYKDNYQFRVQENSLTKILCGPFRPGHFEGVLTVVLKLLALAQADNAYFGEKDYQQFLLIKKMAESFFLPVNIIGCPTIREKDGLAMSSRNTLLSPEARSRAPLIFEFLRSKMSDGEIAQKLGEVGFVVDYVETHFGRRFVAAKIDGIRLIDNVKI
jgi:pantoate--beta-alanine ligase